MTTRALLLIDIQNDYFPGGMWPLKHIETASDNAALALEAARQNGDRVIHVRHEFSSPDAPFFLPGSPGAQIHTKVQPRDGEPVILKHQVNAFLGTSLQDTLQQQGVQSVTLVGNMSHMCIDAAARACSDLGHAVTVLHDACATRDQEFDGRTVPAEQVQAAYMAALAFAYAKVISTRDHLAA